jgi:hypothetical protein
MTLHRLRALIVVLAATAGSIGGAAAQGSASPSDPGAPKVETGANPPPSAVPAPTPPVSPAAAAPVAAEASWHTITGPQGSFTAALPAAPRYTTAEMKTATGSSYMLHQYLLEHAGAAYIVQSATYPDDINVANPRANLQGGLDNLAKGMEGAKWASVDWITLQGSTAVDAIGTRGGHAIRSFSAMKGSQMFTLIYAGTPGTARSDDVNRFVASLHVRP